VRKGRSAEVRKGKCGSAEGRKDGITKGGGAEGRIDERKSVSLTFFSTETSKYDYVISVCRKEGVPQVGTGKLFPMLTPKSLDPPLRTLLFFL
jgi:hypothetical protein